MARPVDPVPVRPFLSVLVSRVGLFDRVLAQVATRWGDPDVKSDILDFGFTDYYEPEMGRDLKRRLYSYPKALDPSDLAEVKLWTNGIEEQVAAQATGPVARPVNLDPGYINDSKVVLASAKDHVHRIYLSLGIFAEITLSYQHGAWRAMPWTYPDYRSEPYLAYFDRLRLQYMCEGKT